MNRLHHCATLPRGRLPPLGGGRLRVTLRRNCMGLPVIRRRVQMDDVKVSYRSMHHAIPPGPSGPNMRVKSTVEGGNARAFEDTC